MRTRIARIGLSFAFIAALQAQPAIGATAQTSTYIKSVYSLPLSLDPVLMNDTASIVAGNLIYEGLLRFSSTLSLEGALAESWSTSPDGLKLTFKLRSGAKFHDGSPVTANDVVASLSRTLSSSSRVQSLYESIDKTAGIRAIDTWVVEIRLKHPFPPFLSILAGATAKILPARLLHSKDFFKQPIGSGPFRFVTRQDAPQKQIILEAFPGFHGDKPKLDRLILQENSEAEALTLASKGELHDLANWPLTGEEPVFKQGRRIQGPLAATWIIGLNANLSPFTSKITRQRFRDAIDAEGFRKRFFPEALPAYGYVPPGLPGYMAKPTGARISKPTSAAKLTNTTKIRLVIPQELARNAEMKNFFESNLRSQGWNVEVVPIAWDKLMEGYNQKTHQAFLVSMNMDYPDAEFLLRGFESKSPMNFSGIRSPRIDALLAQSRTERDRQKRQELYRDALALVADEAVTINLFHPMTNIWASDCVRGLAPNLLSDVYIDYTNVSLQEACKLSKFAGLTGGEP